MNTDFFPVGAVLAFAGTALDPETWILCDGSNYSKELNPELFHVIKHTYGGSDDVFKVPDYRGYFMRGASGDSAIDPDADTRIPINHLAQLEMPARKQPGTIQAYSTRLPDPHFTSVFNGLPYATRGTHGALHDQAAQYLGDYSGPLCNYGGGDKETRPVNVYVNYFIKAR